MVCERWSDFSLFLEDMGERKTGKTIDRINQNEHYCPDNCRWSTQKEQSRNRRDSIKTVFNGEKVNLVELAEKYGISKTTIYRRYKQGLRGGELVERINRNAYRVGEKATSKLTWDSVREIRKMLMKGLTHSVISAKYGVSQSVISEIKNNKTWKVEFDPLNAHYAKVAQTGAHD